MSQRELSRRKLRKFSIGDMRDCITLETRAMAAPLAGSAAYTQDYTPFAQPWAKVDTGSGVARGFATFDGVEEGQAATHRFTIRYRDDVTTQTRIRYKSDLYKILLVDDTETREEYLIMFARLVGAGDLEANQ